jgi:leucyl aminopeptidase
LLRVLALAAFATATQWYQQSNLGDFHLNSLISRDCFRGTYGSLSLFTCPLQHVNIEPFADLSKDAKLCVIESQFHVTASRLVEGDGDVKVLFNDNEKYIIVSVTEGLKDYPQSCFVDTYHGAALNVYTVASASFRPSSANPPKVTEPKDAISEFIAKVTPGALQTLVTELAFSPGTAPDVWNTRNSYAPVAKNAINWIQKQFELSGAPNVNQWTFRTDMCNNVIAEYPGSDLAHEIVVVGSHADSRNTNNSDQVGDAPGADDNGTGTAINLLFARLLQQTEGLAQLFRRTLRLITFCGEEQGLVGSRAIAQQYKREGQNIVGMFNVDMVGYQMPGQNTTLAFMTGSADPVLTNYCKGVVNTYMPTTAVGNSGACCSDQQAFYEQNYPALGLFETPTNSVQYPNYHRVTDIPDGNVSFPQVALFAQAVYACTLNYVL